MPTLKGANVHLRPLEEDDLDVIVEWRNEPENWACFFNKFPLTRSGQRDFYASLRKSERKKLFVVWTNEGERIGTIGFDDSDFPNQSAEYGTVLIADSRHRGKGYAEEASNLLLGYCFGTLNLSRVWLRVYSDNPSAIRLYEKCGFEQEGVLRKAVFSEGRFRDVTVMSILKR